MADPPIERLLKRTSINDFPDEVLLEILRNIGVDRAAQKQHYNFCLVNRRFQRIATEFLYYRVIANDIDILQLLRTITKNPSLASFIHEVNLHPSEARQEWTIKTNEKFLAAQIRALGLSSSYEDELLSQLRLGVTARNVPAAVLLLQCPNVTGLELLETSRLHQWLHDPRTYWVAAFDEKRYVRPLSSSLESEFRQLRKIRLNQYCVMIREIVPLFSLKALEDLEVSCLSFDDSRDFEPSVLKRHMSNIKRLKLPDGCVGPKTIAALISACKSLDTFVYSTLYYGYGGRGEITVDVTPIVAALQQHETSLRRLVLLDTYVTPGSDPCDPAAQPLRNFSNLKKLRLDVGAVYGFDPPWLKLSEVLPPDLKKLRIDNCWDNIYDNIISSDGLLSTMIGTKDCVFPCLGYLDIFGPLLHPRELNSALADEFQHRGIEFKIQ